MFAGFRKEKENGDPDASSLGLCNGHVAHLGWGIHKLIKSKVSTDSRRESTALGEDAKHCASRQTQRQRTQVDQSSHSDTLVRNQLDLGEAKPDKKGGSLGWRRIKEYRLQRTTREAQV